MEKRRASWSAASVLLAVLGASLPLGCIEGGELAEYTCKDPHYGHRAPDGSHDPCCERSPDTCPGRATPPPTLPPEPAKPYSCQGDCIPRPPRDYDEFPFLVWLADSPDKLPACDLLPHDHTPWADGAFDMDSSYTCPACTCGAPSCTLPAQLTAHSLTCSGDGQGAVDTPFPAPPGWDGQCTAPTSVPSEDSRSLSIAPLTVGACAPSVPVPFVPPPVRWGTYVRGCKAWAPGTCSDSSNTWCIDSALRVPAGALQCVWYRDPGDTDCSDIPAFPKRYRIHTVKEPMRDGSIDTRGCSPCTCGAPEGSNCTALVSTFANATCSGFPFNAAMVSSDPSPKCHDVAPTMGLQSMSAEFVTNEPGACTPSGGKPIGAFDPVNYVTICCRNALPGPAR